MVRGHGLGNGKWMGCACDPVCGVVGWSSRVSHVSCAPVMFRQPSRDMTWWEDGSAFTHLYPFSSGEGSHVQLVCVRDGEE